MCGTASRMIFAKWKNLRSSGDWSAHRAALRANVQCTKVNSFIFAFAYTCISFLPSLLSTCFALLNFYFAFLFQFALLLQISYYFSFLNYLRLGYYKTYF